MTENPDKNLSPLPKRHIPVLDGVRAVAVLIVICFHFWQTFTSGSYTMVGRLAVWGQTGVDLFFVLSGLLITGILLDSKGSEHFLRNFYVRRVLRIFPLYYLTLIAVYLICPLLKLSEWVPWNQSLWFWTYAQNIPMAFAPKLASGPGHFWSLAVEEHYYFCWPLLVMLLDRNRLLRVLAAAIGLSLLTRIVFSQYGMFYFTLARLDGLAIGSGLAVFMRSRPEGLKRFVGPAVFMLCSLGVILAGTQLVLSGKGLLIVQVLKSTLIAVVYACVLILVIENRCGEAIGRVLAGRVLGSVGKYSYGMYVFHPFVIGGLYRAGLSYGLAGLALSILLTYIAASISWTVCEKRFLGLKRHFEYSSKGQVSCLTAVNK